MTKWELKTSYVNKRIQSTRMNKIKTKCFFFLKKRVMQKSPINPFPNASKINLYNRIKEYVNNVAKNHKNKPKTQPISKTTPLRRTLV